MTRRTLFQAFEWYVKPEDKLWQKIAKEAEWYHNLGITAVWLPPAYKGFNGNQDSGYGVYDLYDLGEFDQKGSIPTKYGTKDEYLAAIAALKQQSLKVIVDIVLNHRIGADATETLDASLVNDSNRLESLENKTIEAWTVFDFPGRKGKYSNFKWRKEHFKGIDYDAKDHQSGVFLFKGKQWDHDVDGERANYDYLMGADIDFNNQEVRDELLRWIRWYKDVVAFDGVRLDAVKHIQFPFFKEALLALRGEDDLLEAVGEYWSGDLIALHNYLMDVDFSMSLFDVPLHNALHEASREYERFDLRTVFNGTLVSNNPEYAITFVDNHDTQPGQSLESPIEAWFKPHAYALILLRNGGVPCVFYGDLYGNEEHGMVRVECLPVLLTVRKNHLNGTCYNFIDDARQIGWTFTGDDKGSGCAVVLNNDVQSSKRMFVGKRNAKKWFVDVLEPSVRIQIDENGIGEFGVEAQSIGVYICEEEASDAGIL